MTPSKKPSFLIIAVLYGISLVLTYFVFPIWEYRYVSIISYIVLTVASIYMLIQIYGLDTYLRSKLIFLGLLIFSSYFLLSFFPTLGDYSRIAFIAATSIGLYMLLLALNVYIVSERRGDSIPLLQPAKVIAYLSIVASVFLSSTIIYKLEWFISDPVWNLLIKGTFFAIFYILIFIYTSWIFVSEGGVGGETFNSEDMQLLKRLQIFAVYCMLQLSIALMFFPFEAFGRAVILGGAVYYLSNFIQNYLVHKVNLKFLIETLTALIIIYTLVYFT